VSCNGRVQVSSLQRELTDIRDDLASADEKHKAEVNRLRAERERSKKDGVQMQEDLLQRLQNACNQRDEAREQARLHPVGRGSFLGFAHYAKYSSYAKDWGVS
jgi:predicted phage gp36 major capsid-like protein